MGVVRLFITVFIRKRKSGEAQNKAAETDAHRTLCGVAPGSTDIDFLALLAIFGIAYFGIILPVFHGISQKFRGRRFVIRLGTPWNIKNAEHRWDVLLSFVSFMITLGISLFIFNYFFPLGEVGR